MAEDKNTPAPAVLKAAKPEADVALVKHKDQLISSRVELGEHSFTNKPVKVPAGDAEALLAARDEQGRKYVAKA